MRRGTPVCQVVAAAACVQNMKKGSAAWPLLAMGAVLLCCSRSGEAQLPPASPQVCALLAARGSCETVSDLCPAECGQLQPKLKNDTVVGIFNETVGGPAGYQTHPDQICSAVASSGFCTPRMSELCKAACSGRADPPLPSRHVSGLSDHLERHSTYEAVAQLPALGYLPPLALRGDKPLVDSKSHPSTTTTNDNDKDSTVSSTSFASVTAAGGGGTLARGRRSPHGGSWGTSAASMAVTRLKDSVGGGGTKVTLSAGRSGDGLEMPRISLASTKATVDLQRQGRRQAAVTPIL
eukprot:SAG31_NODE_9002_length_1349_cov_1.791200_1_plen_294_part_00